MFKVIHGEKAPDLANVGVRRVGGTLVREPVVTIPRWWLVLRWLLSPVGRLLAMCLRHPVPTGLVVFTVALYGYVGERTFVGGALVLAVLLVSGGSRTVARSTSSSGCRCWRCGVAGGSTSVTGTRPWP